MASENATVKALATPELLEGILFQVENKSLLASAQRVCQSWRAAVLSSVLLQRKLFFLSEDAIEGQTPQYNPLVYYMFPVSGGDSDGNDDPKKAKMRKGMVHRMFTSAAFYRQDASWRGMHIRHPPVRCVGGWSFISNTSWYHRLQVMRFTDGARMEALWELGLRHGFGYDANLKWCWPPTTDSDGDGTVDDPNVTKHVELLDEWAPRAIQGVREAEAMIFVHRGGALTNCDDEDDNEKDDNVDDPCWVSSGAVAPHRAGWETGEHGIDTGETILRMRKMNVWNR